MGRLHHLSHTLPVNLRNTANCPDCEFIILNYGSKDGLHEWAKDNLKPLVAQGRVKYYRTQEPQYFSATHAKNIAHRQATGDILCNLDADNYIVEGFVESLLSTFHNFPCVVCAPECDLWENPGSCGKIAVLKEHFYSVNGYDEDWNIGWGCDDTNFQFRVRMHNNLPMVLSDKKWCVVIPHSNEERVANFRDKNFVKTGDMATQRLKTIAISQEYVANKNRAWGFAADLSSDLDT